MRKVFCEPELSDYLTEAIDKLQLEEIYNDPRHQFTRGSNGKLRGGCPFHDSKSGTSFVADETKQWWCAGCNEGGGPADYRASLKQGHCTKARGSDFIEVARELIEEAAMTMPERSFSPEQWAWIEKDQRKRSLLKATAETCQEHLWSDLPPAIQARQYLIEQRGLTEDGIRELGLGLYPSHKLIQARLKKMGFTPADWKGTGCVWTGFDCYITFPWRDAQGRMLTIYGRYNEATPPDGKPKTIALPGQGSKSSPLYLDRAIANRHKHVVAVEGVLDAALLQAKGDTRVVAYVAASFSDAQIQTLKRKGIEAVTLCGDPDQGGEKGTDSNLRRLTLAGIAVFVAPKLPDRLDPDEFVIREGLKGWNDHINAAEHGFTWKARMLVKKCINGTDSGKRHLINSANAFARGMANV